MAGNFGYSDSDTATTNVDGVFAKYAPHYVKIDQVIPTLSTAVTGKEYDSTLKKDKANSKSVKVTFDGNVDDATVAASDFSITLDTGGAKVPTGGTVNNADVYLTLEGTIPSNDKPKVTIVGSISDKAGNVTDSGSIANATYGIPPVLTITTGSGSGSRSGFLISDNDGTSISVDSKTFSRKVCLLNFTISSYSCPTPT